MKVLWDVYKRQPQFGRPFPAPDPRGGPVSGSSLQHPRSGHRGPERWNSLRMGTMTGTKYPLRLRLAAAPHRIIPADTPFLLFKKPSIRPGHMPPDGFLALLELFAVCHIRPRAGFTGGSNGRIHEDVYKRQVWSHWRRDIAQRDWY